MFNRTLADLTLSSNTADTVFSNISGIDFNGDWSFIATLRALLLPRVGTECINLVRTHSSYSDDQIKNNPLRTIIEVAFGRFNPGNLIVHSASSQYQKARDALFESLDDEEKGFVKLFPKFHEMTNIRDFVASKMRARFYTSDEDRMTVIVVDSLNTRKWHFIQSFIPRYFKWYFETSPVTPEETALLASLTRKSSEDYERIVEEFASKYDMRTHLIKSMLGEFEKNARRQQLDGVEHRIEDARSELNGIDQRYADVLRLLEELNINRAGIIDAMNNASDDSEIIEYFTANKGLDPVNVRGMSLEFIVKTYLDTWDPDLYERMSKKKTSTLYSGYHISQSIFEDFDKRKKFIDAIFSDEPLLRIKLCGYYKIDMCGDVTSARGYNYGRAYNDRMPNPHLQKFNCLGEYKRYIRQSLRNGDTIGAIEQCVASCKSLNLTEPQTFQWFFEHLFDTDMKVIELPDKTSVSPADAMTWLLEQDKKEEAHEDA